MERRFGLLGWVFPGYFLGVSRFENEADKGIMPRDFSHAGKAWHDSIDYKLPFTTRHLPGQVRGMGIEGRSNLPL